MKTIDRQRISYSLMLPACKYVVYYDVPDQLVSLFPITICNTRDEAAKICRTITDEEVLTEVNNRLEKIKKEQSNGS